MTLVEGAVEEVDGLFSPACFDAVLCQGVLMYFADPEPVLDSVARVVAPGGTVSLLVRNGDALAMRPGLLRDWEAAAGRFDGTGYHNRIGVDARADRLGELTAAAGAARCCPCASGTACGSSPTPSRRTPDFPTRRRSKRCWRARSGPGGRIRTGGWRLCCT